MREVTLYANRHYSLEGMSGGEYLAFYDEYEAQTVFPLGIPCFGLLACSSDGRDNNCSITHFALCVGLKDLFPNTRC